MLFVAVFFLSSQEIVELSKRSLFYCGSRFRPGAPLYILSGANNFFEKLAHECYFPGNRSGVDYKITTSFNDYLKQQ